MNVTQDQIDDIREKAYEMGSRTALIGMLRYALRGLGYGEDFTLERMIVEREEAISALRRVCKDQEWPEDLHLADIIDKHL